MNSILRKSFLLLALFAEYSYALQAIITDIRIESEFGVTLGDNINKYSISREIEKKEPWTITNSYILDFDGELPYTISVGTNVSGQIYAISVIHESANCDDIAPKIKANLEKKYEVVILDDYFKITSQPDQNEHREISGFCSGKTLSYHVRDKLLREKARNLNSESERSYKASLPECGMGYLRPIHWGWMSSAYGKRTDPFSGKPAWHDGIDFAAKLDQLVYASDNGVILSTSFDQGYGNRVEILHGNGDITTYSHLNSFLIGVGESVVKGQPIAKLGSTGKSTGPHVGFGLKRNGEFIDPQPYMVDIEKCRPKYLELN
jgi:murein DD-endopeptidase MepM/ murein hydrolase activator NlpD